MSKRLSHRTTSECGHRLLAILDALPRGVEFRYVSGDPTPARAGQKELGLSDGPEHLGA